MAPKDGKKKLRLPVQQLLILATCRIAEPIALTSVFPYLPEMIESFGVPTDEIAQWAGTTAAIFSFSQALTGIAWGRASDRLGRKYTILLALFSTFVSNILFGFSKTLIWALTARALAGLANGSVGVHRTTVAELVPERELQPRAFALMPMVWQIGSIIGPSLGGVLVHPNEHFPGIFHHSRFFEVNPFALPGLVTGVFFAVGLITGFLFLRETLDSRKNRRDYGLELGKAITSFCSGKRETVKTWKHPKMNGRPAFEEETQLLLEDSDTEASQPPPIVKPKLKQPTYSEVLTRQSNINLISYTLLGMHSVSYDQLFPVFLHHPYRPPPPTSSLIPIKFSSGFGLKSARIGLLTSIYGVVGMLLQFTLFPPVARKYGVLNCFRAIALLSPIVYFLTPFTALLPTDNLRQGVMLALMLCKAVLCVFGFPCSMILLTNSAQSVRNLGTLNGISVSVSSLGRGLGPAICGIVFTWGVDRGYVVAPWWVLALMAAIAAVPAFYLVEMDGLAQDRQVGNDQEGEESGHTTTETPVSATSESRTTGRETSR